MLKWLAKLWSQIFIHIPTEKEIQQRNKETAEKLGIVFFDEKKRDEFIKEIREYNFLEGIEDLDNKSSNS